MSLREPATGGRPLDEGATSALDAGRWLPYDNSEVSAVQEASAALEESGSPLGIDPRVAELRAQLSNLFGVSLDAPRAPQPPLAADEPASFADDIEGAESDERDASQFVADEAVADEAVADEPVTEGTFAGGGFEPDVAPVAVNPPAEAAAPETDSDPVRSWLEYLKNRNAPAPAVSTEARPAAAPPVAATPVLKPEPPPAPVAATPTVPLVRQNKSAVRLEISHLRDVANRHTRGVLAVKPSEQKARLWWFLSGASMVVLCFISMALLKSGTPIVRWLGWMFLCGAAVNLAVCVNSFQRLKTRAEGEEEPADATARAERTGEAESDLLTPEMEARLESILQTEEEQTPVESHT